MSSSLTVKAYLALVDERTKNDYIHVYIWKREGGREREGGRWREGEKDGGRERRWRERGREKENSTSIMEIEQ